MFFNKQNPEPPPTSDADIIALEKRLQTTKLPDHVLSQAKAEVARLAKTDPLAPEYGIGRNYVDLLLSLPWQSQTKDNLNLERAQSILASHHHGLDLVKERVLESLAVRTLKEQERGHILVVDDEQIARENLAHFLSRQQYQVSTACNGKEALAILEQGGHVDLIITDLKMDEMDGLTLIKKINRLCPTSQLIMVTGYATVETAVQAMKGGAAHFLSKPVDLGQIKNLVDETLVRKTMGSLGPVLCFAGPPGTGKTSIGSAVATALGRKFIRLSMAGLRDEAEIRGHRRTYVGAMPGRIISELKRCQVNNPVFVLDEIDKIGQDFKGDPASVLLEVLDPEQNSTFVDHYLEIPFDLSAVMFITTANNIEQLPGPLLDRLDIINFPSYSDAEKLIITQQYILPRQIEANGLQATPPHFSPEALSAIIQGYTRESGLRGLTRQVAAACRKLALLRVQDKGDGKELKVDQTMIRQLIGPPIFKREAAEGEDRVGVVTSLVWTEFGGEIMFVETLKMTGHKQLILTGSLGNVLQESAQTALSYLRSNAGRLGIAENFFETIDIHIHLPAGAVSKDGPSAGAAIVAALISLLTGRAARRDVAISGEISLTGQLLPVAGIREKLLAAQRAGVKTVILPAANREEVECLALECGQGMEIELASSVIDFIDTVLYQKADSDQSLKS